MQTNKFIQNIMTTEFYNNIYIYSPPKIALMDLY